MIEVMHISGDNGHASMQGSQETETQSSSCEEYANLTRELATKRTPYRPPKRAQSTTYDYRIPTVPRDYPGISIQPTVPEHPSGETSPTNGTQADSRPATPKPDEQQAPRKRPPLPPPRRSYSVMDYEPPPQIHRLSKDFSLMDLPPEIHFNIFDWLDPIDSTCLGLTNKHFYDIHYRMHGKVPLPARRSGPNNLEWAWHLAGTVKHAQTEAAAAAAVAAAQASERERRAMLRVRGQALCRKCGVNRCELHKHIREWMGPEYEYCTVREKFGPVAPEGASKDCYMSSPRDPHRCGRHRVRKGKEQVAH